MFIDYVTLMLINMVGQLVILAFFLYKGMDSQDKASWAPAFGTAGLVGVICGFMMIFTSPLPKPYSMAFGEMTVLMSILFVAAAGRWRRTGISCLWGFTPFSQGSPRFCWAYRLYIFRLPRFQSYPARALSLPALAVSLPALHFGRGK